LTVPYFHFETLVFWASYLLFFTLFYCTVFTAWRHPSTGGWSPSLGGDSEGQGASGHALSKQTKLFFRCWATVLWRWDDIAFMLVVTIQAVNAHCDLVIRIGFAASGMADRDLVIADHPWACWATVL